MYSLNYKTKADSNGHVLTFETKGDESSNFKISVKRTKIEDDVGEEILIKVTNRCNKDDKVTYQVVQADQSSQQGNDVVEIKKLTKAESESIPIRKPFARNTYTDAEKMYLASRYNKHAVVKNYRNEFVRNATSEEAVFELIVEDYKKLLKDIPEQAFPLRSHSAIRQQFYGLKDMCDKKYLPYLKYDPN